MVPVMSMDICNNNPETGDKSGYYHINDNQQQWTYCNMTPADDDFISGVGGGWRIVNINISAGNDCPGEWRKATQSGVSFSSVQFVLSSASLSTVE